MPVFCCFRKVLHVLSTAEGLLTQEDRVTADGLQEVFVTNVFGHFVLVKCQQGNAQCWGPGAVWAQRSAVL